MKKYKGITLVALVVTIVILLILAGVTMATVTGQNGIINQSKKMSETTEQKQGNSQIGILSLENKLASNSDEITLDRSELQQMINKIVDSKLDQKLQEEKLNIYPVGSIYISTSSQNPSEFIGGTWESYGQGRTLVGQGTGTDSNSQSISFNAGSTGGEYNHTLSIAEMPKHDHDVSLSYTQQGLNNAWVRGQFAVAWTDYVTAGWETGAHRGNGGSGRFGITNATGGSQAHNNIQPYIVTYMWKRIS